MPIIFDGSDHRLTTVFSQRQFHWSHHLVVTGNEAGTFFLALILAGVLYLLLRRTRLGTTTRAIINRICPS